MYTVFFTINVITIIFTAILIFAVLKSQPSRAQNVLILSLTSAFVYSIALHLELSMSESVNSALLAIRVQYIFLSIFLVSILWFISLFGKFRIPGVVYIIQCVIGTISIMGVFLTDRIPLFYSKMKIDYHGAYNRIVVEPGPIWILFYVHLGIVLISVIVLGIYHFRRTTEIGKRRIAYIISGTGILVVELILKACGVFGTYNPVSFALLLTLLCLYIAFVKYGYFNSVQVAVENVMNHGGDGLLVVDDKGRVLFANELMRQLVPELQTIRFYEESRFLQDAFSKKVDNITCNQTVYDFWVEEIYEQGESIGKSLHMRDMTEHYHYVEKLKAASAAKTEFLARMSHEIRTPISTMLGMNEMILRENKEEKVREYANGIEEAGRVLLSLISDILDLSKIESGKVEIVEGEYEVGTILNDVWNMVAFRAREKNLKLHFEIDKTLPSRMWGDEIRIKQILINLLTNAVKYTHSGAITLAMKSVTQYGETNKCMLMIKVRDTGIGIKIEDRNKIFENFERADEEKNKTTEGVGLGLSITKQLIELMGGIMTVESEYGKGSEFTVTFSQRIIDDTPMGEFSEWKPNFKKKGKDKDVAASFIAPKGKILVVDDNAVNRTLLERLLGRLEIRVEKAGSGEEAISKIKENHYHIIFMDYMMPDMDGVETLNRIHELVDHPNKETPVIIMTANAISGAKAQFLENGFCDYISKPLDITKLEQMIRTYLPEELVEMA